ncbi:MAG: hypothetical protein HY898_03245 [Deltaproteobacteria bacterium]|nr:hypothetical protein [Deltaproteobacteria bacterium]
MPVASKRSRRPDPGIQDILSAEAGQLKVGTARAMVMTETAFNVLQQVISEQTPEFLVYGFYEMGYRVGLDIAASSALEADAPEDAFRVCVDTYRKSGYGEVEVVEFDIREPSARLRGTNLLEAAAARGGSMVRSPRAICHYSRGMFAGLFSRILGKEVVCEELACEYRNDPCCEFTVLAFGGQPTG